MLNSDLKIDVLYLETVFKNFEDITPIRVHISIKNIFQNQSNTVGLNSTELPSC